jgi:tetratricopeptide (TPR) repeat protein
VEFALAEEARPNDTDILTATAQLMMRRGHWDEAVKRFQRTADLNPRSPETNLAAGEALALMHQYGPAARHMERAIAVDAEYEPAHVMLAMVDLLRTGDRARAREASRAIILRFGAERYAATSFEELMGVLDSTDRATLERVSISAFAGNAVGYYYWRATLFDMWKPEAARAAVDSLIVAARTLIIERPNDPGVEAARGWLHVIKGHPDSAAQSARRALELAPLTDDAAAWSNAAHRAARVFVRIGEYESAIDLIEQLLRAPSWISVATLRTDPMWAPLREYPPFQRLIARG